MKILLDTNVLLRMAQPEAEAAQAVLHTLDVLGLNGYRCFLVPQVIYEYWVVCSRPVDQNGLGHQLTHIARDIGRLQQMFTLLRDERAIFENWQLLVRDYEVHGKNAHDARLVAAMKRHAIDQLLTINSRDFQRYQEITIHVPTVGFSLPRAGLN